MCSFLTTVLTFWFVQFNSLGGHGPLTLADIVHGRDGEYLKELGLYDKI